MRFSFDQWIKKKNHAFEGVGEKILRHAAAPLISTLGILIVQDAQNTKASAFLGKYTVSLLLQLVDFRG